MLRTIRGLNTSNLLILIPLLSITIGVVARTGNVDSADQKRASGPETPDLPYSSSQKGITYNNEQRKPQIRCPEIYINSGRIGLSPPQKNCSVKIIDTPDIHYVTGITGHLEGRWYGLLEIVCNGCLNIKYSPIQDCDDCILCRHNEIISKCKSFALPLTVGIVLATIVFSTLTFLLWRYCPFGVTDLFLAGQRHYYNRKYEKSIRLKKRLDKITQEEVVKMTTKEPKPPKQTRAERKLQKAQFELDNLLSL
ncbi:MAG: hypothetical protein FMLXV2_gp3 [Fushun monolepta lauta xinmovirus 2]|uniref:Uncharacterized protein n=1 Tax=Fushun monolepta lauta xinmovirus 2 TaxID=2905555 RepID=A0A8K1XY56_9MONO|nr:MAG: hypothetical protein FMLXV2_gp3 [Fushun monolepta lauta xinmovirus 2]